MDIQLGVEVTPDTIREEKPGVVIIAAGSKPFIPEIPGIGRDTVATATDLLLGKRRSKIRRWWWEAGSLAVRRRYGWPNKGKK